MLQEEQQQQVALKREHGLEDHAAEQSKQGPLAPSPGGEKDAPSAHHIDCSLSACLTHYHYTYDSLETSNFGFNFKTSLAKSSKKICLCL